MATPSQTPAPKAGAKTGTKQKVIIGGLVVLLVAAAVVIYLLLRPQPDDDLGLVTDDNLGYIGNQLAEKIDKATFQTYMNTTWRFPAGDQPSSNAVIGNASVNNYPFYFTVVLNEEDGEPGEEVYRSGLIPVGRVVNNLTLDTDLPAGDYQATCFIQLVEEETEEEVETNLGFSVTLRVES